MTANELADIVDHWAWKESAEYLTDAAAMLRQQQAEIEKLGSELDRIVELYTDKAIENEALKKELALQRLSDIGQEIEQEPVAWVSVLGIDHIGQKFTDVRVSLTKTDVADIPLYTHPTQLKKASEK